MDRVATHVIIDLIYLTIDCNLLDWSVLHHFLSVPPEAAQDLKVFSLEELLAALEQYVEEFLAVPNKYVP